MLGSRQEQSQGSLITRKGWAGRVKLICWPIFLATAGFGAYFWFTGPGKPAASHAPTDLITVKRGSVDLRVSATGVIRPFNQIKVSPKLTGLLKRLYVQQGDVVRKGQLLAEMDDSNLLGQYKAAKAAYDGARTNYEKTMRGNRPQEVADAQAQYRKAESLVRAATMAVARNQSDLTVAQANQQRDQTNAGRLTLLASQGAISDQDRLNAHTTSEVSKAVLEKVKQELKLTDQLLAQSKSDLESSKERLSMSREGYRSEDIESARQTMVQAEGNLNFIASQIKDTRILAPFDGIITQKYTDQGAIVTPTTSSATTSATSSSIVSLAGRLEMVAAVAETDMEHIYLEQPVTIIANAYADRKFHGKVTLVAPEAIVTQNVTSFEIHTSIDDDPKHMLMSGMNVYSTFKAGTKNDLLVVPTACVASKHGKTGVYIPDDKGQPDFHKVVVGPSSGTQTAILVGLKEGDQVFIGLSKEKLIEEGYATDSSKQPGGGGGGSGSGAPIPRGFGKKM